LGLFLQSLFAYSREATGHRWTGIWGHERGPQHLPYVCHTGNCTINTYIMSAMQLVNISMISFAQSMSKFKCICMQILIGKLVYISPVVSWWFFFHWYHVFNIHCAWWQNYLKCVRSGDKQDLRVFRLTSLWFDNASHPAVNKEMKVSTLHSEYGYDQNTQ
jgi:hypothetical protein